MPLRDLQSRKSTMPTIRTQMTMIVIKSHPKIQKKKKRRSSVIRVTLLRHGLVPKDIFRRMIQGVVSAKNVAVGKESLELTTVMAAMTSARLMKRMIVRKKNRMHKFFDPAVEWIDEEKIRKRTLSTTAIWKTKCSKNIKLSKTDLRVTIGVL